MSTREKVFEDSYMNFINKVKTEGLCEIDDLANLIAIMQENEMDTHLVIAGQNGSGKSFLELMIGKKLNKDKLFERYYLADKSTDDIIQFLLANSNTTLCVDELNLYLSYKQHASTEQNHLVNMLELARSKRIALVGCIRDPRKLTLNYRDGKMSIIIWVLDRYKDRSGAYAVVLVGNPALEGEDRFGISWLQIATPDFEQMRRQLESLPSFIGYMKIPSASSVLTKEEITHYKEMKDLAMAHAHLNVCIKKLKNKKMDMEDFLKQVNELKKILGEEVIEQRVGNLTNPQTGLRDYLEEDD